MTRDNWEADEKLNVTWAAVSGAEGYNLACTVSTHSSPLTSWSWWHCGSVNSGSTTTFTVDKDGRGGRDQDLSIHRSYAVAVRAVTSNPSDASPWLVSADAHAAIQPYNISASSTAGSVSLSWTPPKHAQGYEVDCATYATPDQPHTPSTYQPSYTRCADVETATTTDGVIKATITSWTVSGTTYTIADSTTYDIRVRTTNAWGESTWTLAPLVTTAASSVSNLTSPTSIYFGSINSTISQAVAFTTGSSAGGYTLKSITLPLSSISARNGLGLELRAMQGTGDYSTTSVPADTALAAVTFSGTDPTTSTFTDTTYTCSGSGCKLSPDTTYFVVATNGDSNSNGYRWAVSTTEIEVAVPSNNGWSIGHNHYTSGSTWTTYDPADWSRAAFVFATDPPPPATLSAGSIGATNAVLTIANHTGAWYYKANTGPHTSCSSAQSGTTATLSGLTAGTTYTYKAYSDSTCTTANLLATASAFTTAITAGNLGETSAQTLISLSDRWGSGVHDGQRHQRLHAQERHAGLHRGDQRLQHHGLTPRTVERQPRLNGPRDVDRDSRGRPEDVHLLGRELQSVREHVVLRGRQADQRLHQPRQPAHHRQRQRDAGPVDQRLEHRQRSRLPAGKLARRTGQPRNEAGVGGRRPLTRSRPHPLQSPLPLGEACPALDAGG